jgi:glycine/D-amino acid oxidase-like deaminating enzyme
VGGGFTGALIAHVFARAGISVALVEGDVIGRASTAASSALLLKEPDRGLKHLTERYDARRGRRIWRLSHDAVGELVETLKDLGIACDLEVRRAVYHAGTRLAADRLRDEFEERRRAGFRATWLSPGELRALAGISGFGAILTNGHAEFDPYRACRGLIRSAVGAGAHVFERSAVARINVRPSAVRLYCRGGSLDAAQVVVATGYATPYFRPLAGRFRMYRTYVLATESLTTIQRRELGVADVMLWDTEHPYHYVRWTPRGQLLLGGGDRRLVPGQRRSATFRTATAELKEHFESLWPALSEVRMTAAWDGLFAMTRDSLPYIGQHPRYPRHAFALGYGGNGMTFGILAARLLLDAWHGRKSPDAALFSFARHA